MKSTQIASSIYLLEGAGGNITALMGQDGVLLVDDDFVEMSEKLLAKLLELKGSKPRYIINTHFHYDHTGGNSIFGPTSTIIAPVELRDRLMHEQILWKKKHPAMPRQAWPSITFDSSMSLYLNNEEVEIRHLPKGHTDGDSVVFFKKSKILSMGDLYFSGMYPIFHPEHHGSLRGYIQNIETIVNKITDEYKIVPGHGPISTKAELKNYLEMIQASVATVKRGIASGHKLDKIQKIGLDKRRESFSHGYLNTDRWLELIYKGLTAELP
jgi:glyoxylase-like metal-dependent hydrolase (beta-lactamase superfamily II)